MAQMIPPPVWTSDDRLCGRCGVQLARADDWLCQGCRTALEERWCALTGGPYPFFIVAPSDSHADKPPPRADGG